METWGCWVAPALRGLPAPLAPPRRVEARPGSKPSCSPVGGGPPSQRARAELPASRLPAHLHIPWEVPGVQHALPLLDLPLKRALAGDLQGGAARRCEGVVKRCRDNRFGICPTKMQPAPRQHTLPAAVKQGHINQSVQSMPT